MKVLIKFCLGVPVSFLLSSFLFISVCCLLLRLWAKRSMCLLWALAGIPSSSTNQCLLRLPCVLRTLRGVCSRLNCSQSRMEDLTVIFWKSCAFPYTNYRCWDGLGMHICLYICTRETKVFIGMILRRVDYFNNQSLIMNALKLTHWLNRHFTGARNDRTEFANFVCWI